MQKETKKSVRKSGVDKRGIVPPDLHSTQAHSGGKAFARQISFPLRLKPVRPVTLVEQIVDSIVRVAAKGRFLPGDRLNESEIAEELQISRVPVREALRILETYGIAVRRSGSRGVHLMQVDAESLRDTLSVRASLELLASREAMEMYRRDSTVFAKLDTIIEDMHRAVRDDDAYEHARLDTQFHRTLVGISGNDVLLSLWESLARKLTIIFGLAALAGDLVEINEQHVRLLRLLKSGNPRMVEKEISEHIIGQHERVDFSRLIRKEVQTPVRRLNT